MVTIEANDEAYGVFSFAAGPLNATLEEAGSVTSEANSKWMVIPGDHCLVQGGEG